VPLKPEFVEVLSEALSTVSTGEFGALKEDRTIADLGLDSMSLVELVTVLEERLHTTIEDRKLAELRTLGDLEKLLESKDSTSAGPRG
jgi:acyl carrier protein